MLRHKPIVIILFVLFSAASRPASAALRDIHVASLPTSNEVRKAYADALELESLVIRWSPQWNASIPKAEVANRLGTDLKVLKNARATAPSNAELLLLTGIVAHYAYNVDIPNSWETSADALRAASILGPTDPRSRWFLATNQCQSLDVLEGMQTMLLLEEDSTASLPSDFWVDYMECAEITRMPEHLLRALKRSDDIALPSGPFRTALMTSANSSTQPSDATVTYKADEAWEQTPRQPDGYTSFLCGITLRSKQGWKMQVSDPSKGSCTVNISVGPYPGKHTHPSPTLFLMVRQAEPGETVDDFRKALERKSM